MNIRASVTWCFESCNHCEPHIFHSMCKVSTPNILQISCNFSLLFFLDKVQRGKHSNHIKALRVLVVSAFTFRCERKLHPKVCMKPCNDELYTVLHRTLMIRQVARMEWSTENRWLIFTLNIKEISYLKNAKKQRPFSQQNSMLG